MNNDYTCPRCHNVFPSSNRFLHDMRCTEEHVMPLDKSRQMQIEPQENSHEENKVNPIPSNVNVDNAQNRPRIKEISLKKREDIPEENQKTKKTIHHAPKPRPPESINLSQSGEFPEIFECEICHETLMLKEKEDHMMCHRMEREEMERLERNNDNDNDNDNDLRVSQRSIEQQKMIERQIELDNQRRRQQNQRSREGDIQRQRELERQIERQRQREANRNQNNNIRLDNQQNAGGVRIIRSPNGVTIIRQSGGGSNLNDLGMMNNMLPFFFSNTSENRRQRARIPFDLFSSVNSSINSGFNPEDFLQQVIMMQGNRSHDHPTEEQILNNLPETEIDDVTKLDPEKRNCVICLEEFKNGDKATSLPCIHLFHTSCIKNWLKKQNSCPICKFKITQENMNP